METKQIIKGVTGFQPLIDGINVQKKHDGKDLFNVHGQGEMDGKKVEVIQENEFKSGEGRLKCLLHACVYLIMAIVAPIMGLITLLFSPLGLPVFNLVQKTILQLNNPGQEIDFAKEFFVENSSDYFEFTGKMAGAGALALTCSTVGFGLSFFRALAGAAFHPKIFINVKA